MAERETFSLTDIFDTDQILELITLWNQPESTTEDICTKIIEPNMEQINEKLSTLTNGRMTENYPQYIAYCCEHILRTARIRLKEE